MKFPTIDGIKICVEQKKEQSLVEQIYRANENVRCLKPMVTHCIIHQQVFCSKYLNLPCIIEPIELSPELHHQFNDLTVVVLWFFSSSSGLTLKFSEQKNHPQLLISNSKCLWKLAFPVDLIMFLNEFHLKWQGKTILMWEIYTA